MTADRARSTVRAAFTTQAASYAASDVVADRQRRRWFVDLVDPPPSLPAPNRGASPTKLLDCLLGP